MSEYFKIGDTDLSGFVSGLKITHTHNYNAQTNAQGDSVVDYINSKRQIEVDIIPLEENDFRTVLNAVSFYSVISYRNPATGELTTANCIINNNDMEYFTIQQNRVMYKKLKLTFNEL